MPSRPVKSKPLYVYCPNMIDHWKGWVPAEENDELAAARKFAIEHGMEPNVRESWVTTLPSERYEGDPLYGFKQDNNGMVFIVSPFRLEWMIPEKKR